MSNTTTPLPQKISQIALIVRDIETTALQYAQLFGVDMPQVIITDGQDKTHMLHKGKASDARAKLAFFHLENITIELIEPIGAPSTWQEHLDQVGEGVHHIAFDVADIKQTEQELAKQGYSVEQLGDFEGGCYSYINATDRLKLQIELLAPPRS